MRINEASELRPISYDEFRQLVRRYPRTRLLRSLAEASAVLEVEDRESVARNHPNVFQRFSIAGIARTCILAGNEYRNLTIADRDIYSLCDRYVNIADPDIGGDPGMERLRRMLTRIAYEQFPAQYSPMENLGRAYALFHDSASHVPAAPTDEEWRTVLGVDLDQFMRIGFAAYVAVVQNRGAISRTLLAAEDVRPIFAPLAPEQAIEVLDKHFAEPVDSAAHRGRAMEVRGREKWSPNPLQARPLITADDDFVAPAAHYLIERISPTGLYFIGWEAWDTRFTDALGDMFEHYVGRQLALIPNVQITPEIVYGKSEKRSCDYFIITREIVVLVEVKAARPIVALRTGTEHGEADATKKVGKARDQLVTSARLIRERHPAFTAIPADRPLAGLIVTLEPFFPVQTTLGDDLLANDDLPMAAAWAHEFEALVTSLMETEKPGSDLANALIRADPTQRRLHDLAYRSGAQRNPILDDSWERWADWEQPAAEAST
jgi:hypothetical protein